MVRDEPRERDWNGMREREGGTGNTNQGHSPSVTRPGDCRSSNEDDPARGVEAVSDGAAKNARETRQVGERVAGPAGHYVHSNSMDERLHAGSAALQVSEYKPAHRFRSLPSLPPPSVAW